MGCSSKNVVQGVAVIGSEFLLVPGLAVTGPDDFVTGMQGEIGVGTQDDLAGTFQHERK